VVGLYFKKTYSIKDDANVSGGLPDDASFVIWATNADLKDGAVCQEITDGVSWFNGCKTLHPWQGGEAAALRDGRQ
jgi:hypothetical protein